MDGELELYCMNRYLKLYLHWPVGCSHLLLDISENIIAFPRMRINTIPPSDSMPPAPTSFFFNDDVKPLSWTIPPGMDGTEKVPDSTLGCSFFWGTTCGIFQLHKVHCRGCAWVTLVVSLCFRRRCFGWFLQFLRDHCPSIRCHSFQDEKGLKRPIWCPFCSLVGWLV